MYWHSLLRDDRGKGEFGAIAGLLGCLAVVVVVALTVASLLVGGIGWATGLYGPGNGMGTAALLGGGVVLLSAAATFWSLRNARKLLPATKAETLAALPRAREAASLTLPLLAEDRERKAAATKVQAEKDRLRRQGLQADRDAASKARAAEEAAVDAAVEEAYEQDLTDSTDAPEGGEER